MSKRREPTWKERAGFKKSNSNLTVRIAAYEEMTKRMGMEERRAFVKPGSRKR